MKETLNLILENKETLTAIISTIIVLGGLVIRLLPTKKQEEIAAMKDGLKKKTLKVVAGIEWLYTASRKLK